jgi:hypothetical protein
VISGFKEPSASVSFYEDAPDVGKCPMCEWVTDDMYKCEACDREICSGCECGCDDDLS